MKKILLVAGGTGGHFFPAVALSENLSKHDIEIHLITDKRCKKYLPQAIFSKNRIINFSVSCGFLGKIKMVFGMMLSTVKSFLFIVKIKPNLVIGFGGYTSFPVLLVADMLKIPIILQEQNSILGRTNKFFLKNALLLALYYKDTKNIDSIFTKKVICIDYLVRDSIKNILKRSNFLGEFHLFIFGGSQGAEIFNKIIPDAIKMLPNSCVENLFITQQVDKEAQIALSKKYKKLGIRYKLSHFFPNIDKIYAQSNLVIARSGASTIAELVYIGLPAIFIPLPHAMNDHQYFNAKILEDKNASWCIRQNIVTPEILAKKLSELIFDRKLIYSRSKRLINFRDKHRVNLVDTVLTIME